ncbi:MAG: cytochrome-c oxidase, cbb3-type subunit III [Magnetovibrionaceae bacterium]
MANVEKDALTGTDTTGHAWDGIQELNTPLPKWWLYTFYVTIVWALAYTVVYPSWPTLSSYWGGIAGFSSRAQLGEELAAVKEAKSAWLGKFEQGEITAIAQDPELLNYAMAGGKAIFNENCAPCHGAGGQGQGIFPVLADDAWIWGGTLEDIQTTVTYGIRNSNDDSRTSDMPAFGTDEILEPAQIAAVADYVLSLSSGSPAAGEGAVVFEENCAACHMEDGTGSPDLGAPNLTDSIWLYGSDKEAITAQITSPQHGAMPAWVGRLDPVSIKQVSIYVHSLGGGQ